ncbi:hypothetical protein GCM10010912_09310 [Paenibacillus albidus]|uniref:Uncharacterized protein n=1 Tax=Paenibacillus albidus TaxID=2041023 RepID=A0A917FBZ2_9BACL|nr:hypothetical protein GCM10010912_09310 [Paenibacillus albidus]
MYIRVPWITKLAIHEIYGIVDRLILSPLHIGQSLSAIQLAAQRTNSDKVYHTYPSVPKS